MKILFLTPRDSRKHIGGVETHVRLLTEELERRGHKIREFSLDDAEKRASLDLSTRRRPASLAKRGELLARDDTLFKFRSWRYLWQKRDVFKWADIVHIHDVFWWVVPFAVMSYLEKLLWRVPQHYVSLLPWATSTRRKSASAGYGRADRFLESKNLGPSVFTTFHGWEGEYPPSWSAVLQKKLAQKLSRGTIGVGRFFKKWYGVTPSRVVYGVLDPNISIALLDSSTALGMTKNSLDCHVRQSRTHNDKPKSIAFYGRMDTVNGIEVAIRAFEILKGSASLRRGRALRDEKFQFLFIGDGPARKEAETIGTVTGMVNDPRVFLLQSDLVITSSYLCMLETAALMRPIISIATNPLKNDYLMTHPLATYITICHSPKEIVDRILSYKKSKKQKTKNTEDMQRAYRWATSQTVQKLADTYLRLWNSLSFLRRQESIQI